MTKEQGISLYCRQRAAIFRKKEEFHLQHLRTWMLKQDIYVMGGVTSRAPELQLVKVNVSFGRYSR